MGAEPVHDQASTRWHLIKRNQKNQMRPRKIKAYQGHGSWWKAMLAEQAFVVIYAPVAQRQSIRPRRDFWRVDDRAQMAGMTLLAHGHCPLLSMFKRIRGIGVCKEVACR